MGLYITDQMTDNICISLTSGSVLKVIYKLEIAVYLGRSIMAVKNYTKNILIRAREEEARSWALRASESGKNLSTCIREVLNAWSGLSTRVPFPEVELEGEGSSSHVTFGQVTSSDHGGEVIVPEGIAMGVTSSQDDSRRGSTLPSPSFSSSPIEGGTSSTVGSSLADDLMLAPSSSPSSSIEDDELTSLLDEMDFSGGG